MQNVVMVDLPLPHTGVHEEEAGNVWVNRKGVWCIALPLMVRLVDQIFIADIQGSVYHLLITTELSFSLYFVLNIVCG